MALIDAIQQHLGPTEVNQISQHLGIDPATAQSAISAALPMIMGGMASHAQAGGAQDVQQAIGAHADAADNVGSVLQAGPPADTGASGGLLGRILGGHTQTVNQGVQQATGLDSDKTRKLLMMLAPVVLGVLARRHFGGQPAQQAAPAQVGTELAQEARAAASRSPHVGGLLGSLLNAVEAPNLRT